MGVHSRLGGSDGRRRHPAVHEWPHPLQRQCAAERRWGSSDRRASRHRSSGLRVATEGVNTGQKVAAAAGAYRIKTPGFPPRPCPQWPQTRSAVADWARGRVCTRHRQRPNSYGGSGYSPSRLTRSRWSTSSRFPSLTAAHHTTVSVRPRSRQLRHRPNLRPAGLVVPSTVNSTQQAAI